LTVEAGKITTNHVIYDSAPYLPAWRPCPSIDWAKSGCRREFAVRRASPQAGETGRGVFQGHI